MRPATTPKWPLVLSIVGVIAAIAVIAVALLPLFDGDEDDSVSSVSTSVAVADTGPATSTPVDDTTTATTEAPATTEASATTDAAPTTDAGAGATSEPAEVSTTAAGTSTTVARTTTSAASTTTTSDALGFPSPVRMSLVEATCTAPDSTDSRGNPITFNPLLTIDGREDTAWRCPGASIRQALVFTLAEPSDVSAVAALPGYAGEDPFNGIDRFTQNRRVTRARWGCLDTSGADVASFEQTFGDARSMQATTVTGFTECAKVVFEILDTSAPGNRDFAAVSEIGIYGPV